MLTANYSPEDFILKGCSFEVDQALYEKAIAQGKGVRLDSLKPGQRFRVFDGINTFIRVNESGEFLVLAQARYANNNDYVTHYNNTQGWIVVVPIGKRK